MKTVADLKRRLTVGTLLTLTEYTVGGTARTHKYRDVPRVVTKANSVGFACKPVDTARFPDAEDSYCDWPKKAEFAPDADGEGFGITHGHIHLHYVFATVLKPHFRVFEDGDVIALWGEPDARGLIESYQHVGQHSEASFSLVSELREATAEESAPLLAELRRVGYTIL